MCELLVRVVDKVNTDDFYRNTQCHKRGDVIVVKPDGWIWGTDELANPDWRILRVPDLSVSEASIFLAPELDTDPTQPSKTLQRRMHKLDLDHPAIAQAGLRSFFDDHEVIAIDTLAPTTALVMSDVEVLNDAGAVIAVEHPTYEIVQHDVSALEPALQTMLGAIPLVGPTLRAQCIADASASLLLTLKTTKAPILDPAVLGPSPLVIG